MLTPEIRSEVAEIIVREVAELPDRCSPDYSNNMLVTPEELRDIVIRVLEQAE